MILEFAIMIIVIALFITLLALLLGRRPVVTDFEARQRGLRRAEDDQSPGAGGRVDRTLSSNISHGIAMATDLEYLRRTVGGTGSVEGTLEVGTPPRPQRVKVRISGGIPICPLCGMPMERVEALKHEKTSDYLILRESEDRRWRCYHEFPVLFVPDRPGSATPQGKAAP